MAKTSLMIFDGGDEQRLCLVTENQSSPTEDCTLEPLPVRVAGQLCYDRACNYGLTAAPTLNSAAISCQACRPEIRGTSSLAVQVSRSPFLGLLEAFLEHIASQLERTFFFGSPTCGRHPTSYRPKNRGCFHLSGSYLSHAHPCLGSTGKAALRKCDKSSKAPMTDVSKASKQASKPDIHGISCLQQFVVASSFGQSGPATTHNPQLQTPNAKLVGTTQRGV